MFEEIQTQITKKHGDMDLSLATRATLAFQRGEDSIEAEVGAMLEVYKLAAQIRQ